MSFIVKIKINAFFKKINEHDYDIDIIDKISNLVECYENCITKCELDETNIEKLSFNETNIVNHSFNEKDSDYHSSDEEDSGNHSFGEEDSGNHSFGEEDSDNHSFGEEDSDNHSFDEKDGNNQLFDEECIKFKIMVFAEFFSSIVWENPYFDLDKEEDEYLRNMLNERFLSKIKNDNWTDEMYEYYDKCIKVNV